MADRSTGRLVFHGGSAAVLCGGSRTQVLRLSTTAGRHRDPHAELAVNAGRLLADTSSSSGAYRPLSLVVLGSLGDVRNAGAAWYAVERDAVTVSTGQVTVGGTPSAPTRADLTCGDGVPVTPPAANPSESPSFEPPSELPSLVPSTLPPTTPTPKATLPPVVRQPNNPPTTTRTTPGRRRPARPHHRRGPHGADADADEQLAGAAPSSSSPTASESAPTPPIG